jgi:hypothetical protein
MPLQWMDGGNPLKMQYGKTQRKDAKGQGRKGNPKLFDKYVQRGDGKILHILYIHK